MTLSPLGVILCVAAFVAAWAAFDELVLQRDELP
jgi:hypothetical protein